MDPIHERSSGGSGAAVTGIFRRQQARFRSSPGARRHRACKSGRNRLRMVRTWPSPMPVLMVDWQSSRLPVRPGSAFGVCGEAHLYSGIRAESVQQRPAAARTRQLPADADRGSPGRSGPGRAVRRRRLPIAEIQSLFAMGDAAPYRNRQVLKPFEE